ncbi:hypothetical protein [Mycolicibacterium cosmeticum]|uniref:Short-chain dehydrogenase n=1 Tax=Mycolicibacterium cosmeticum TaxID=258533 RepID=W9BKT3_MYCCO|nr:hypothetical protein [Mycolicibacterium cosmeticum]CDO08450.1 short-chain dehydrogenase [Mycolicibacterium cosmeticum]
MLLVELAQTDTDVWRTAGAVVDDMAAELTPPRRELCAGHVAGMRKSVPITQRLAVPPAALAEVGYTALTSPRSRPCHLVGIGSEVRMRLMANILPSLRDRIVRMVMRHPDQNPTRTSLRRGRKFPRKTMEGV